MLRFFVFGVLFGFSSLSLAQVLKRGGLECEGGLERRAANHREEPDNVNQQLAYGHCLIAAGNLSEGLKHLDDIMDNASDREKIPTAFLYAAYIETGGTFDGIEYKNLTKAIQAYDLVHKLIKSLESPPYPYGGNWDADNWDDIELRTCWKRPYLNIQKFHSGAIGHYRKLKFNSASYTGDKTLETYGDYHKDKMTLTSLEKAIETANDCLGTPYDRRRFTTDGYANTMEISRIIKAAAEKLEPLEKQRLDVADKYSCWRDIFDCEEHQNIKRQMVAILNSMWANLKAL